MHTSAHAVVECADERERIFRMRKVIVSINELGIFALLACSLHVAFDQAQRYVYLTHSRCIINNDVAVAAAASTIAARANTRSRGRLLSMFSKTFANVSYRRNSSVG